MNSANIPQDQSAAGEVNPSRCAAFGCAAEVPLGHGWCGRHWRMIPPALRRSLGAGTHVEREHARQAARQAVETAEFGRRLL